MKTTFILLTLFISQFCFSQTEKQVSEIMDSYDAAKIAEFIANYPSHEKSKELLQKLNVLFQEQDNVVVQKYPGSGPATTHVETVLVSQPASISTDKKYRKTAEVLNRLLNAEPNAAQAVIIVKNKSKCPIVLEAKGNKFYSVSVEPEFENNLLIEKGVYEFTSTICDAVYSSTKNIQKDGLLYLSDKAMEPLSTGVIENNK